MLILRISSHNISPCMISIHRCLDQRMFGNRRWVYFSGSPWELRYPGSVWESEHFPCWRPTGWLAAGGTEEAARGCFVLPHLWLLCQWWRSTITCTSPPSLPGQFSHIKHQNINIWCQVFTHIFIWSAEHRQQFPLFKCQHHRTT